MFKPNRKQRPVGYHNRQQIDKTIYKAAKNWLLRTLTEDAKEHPDFATEAGMFACSVESMGIPRHMTRYFFQTLVESGDLVPHPLGGLMIRGGNGPTRAQLESEIVNTLETLQQQLSGKMKG